MSQKQDIEFREGTVAGNIASHTVPGKDNDYFIESCRELCEVLESFRSDTNNWFEIVDVRVFRGKNIGLPCRYRWTVKRWVVNEMDKWLLENGWDRIAHLKADSRDHKPNEMEARYRKEFDGYTVYCNFYVEITEDVFEALNEGKPIENARGVKQRAENIRKLREKKRA
jgi:hypothetical protein